MTATSTHTRRCAALLAALLLLLALAATAADAAPNVKVKSGSGRLAALSPGQTAWLPTVWKGGETQIDEFRLTLGDLPAGYVVVYPTAPGDGTYTSLHTDATLLKNEMDTARVRISVPTDARTGEIKVTATITYTADGKGERITEVLRMPIVAPSGGPFTQITTDVGPLPGNAGWVSVSLRGDRPDVDAVTVTVIDAAGAVVEYPGAGASTSLQRDARLDLGETDHYAFHLDATGLAPGTHVLRLLTSWSGGPPQETSLNVTVA